MNNRLWNARNPAQGRFKRVLCVCSAGLLRSPTVAWILSQEPFNFNTRAAGSTATFALVLVDDVLLEWADDVVFVNRENFEETEYKWKRELAKKQVHVLDLPDRFEFRSPELVKIATEELKKIFPPARG